MGGRHSLDNKYRRHCDRVFSRKGGSLPLVFSHFETIVSPRRCVDHLMRGCVPRKFSPFTTIESRIGSNSLVLLSKRLRPESLPKESVARKFSYQRLKFLRQGRILSKETGSDSKT